MGARVTRLRARAANGASTRIARHRGASAASRAPIIIRRRDRAAERLHSTIRLRDRPVHTLAAGTRRIRAVGIRVDTADRISTDTRTRAIVLKFGGAGGLAACLFRPNPETANTTRNLTEAEGPFS